MLRPVMWKTNSWEQGKLRNELRVSGVERRIAFLMWQVLPAASAQTFNPHEVSAVMSSPLEPSYNLTKTTANSRNQATAWPGPPHLLHGVSRARVQTAHASQ